MSGRALWVVESAVAGVAVVLGSVGIAEASTLREVVAGFLLCFLGGVMFADAQHDRKALR